jgi:D-lactate dehydrogenase
LEGVNGSCCSQIFSSKGFKDAYSFTAHKIVEKLWRQSNKGSLPIVIDVSSCAYTLHNLRPVLNEEYKTKFDLLNILDSVDFLHDMVLPMVEIKKKKNNIVLHPVCSLQKMKTEYKFFSIARQFAENVTIPKYAGCCGMAGDRGFLFPELTGSAIAPEAKEINPKGSFDGYYSSTKTCEMALSEVVKQNYESILYLVDESL